MSFFANTRDLEREERLETAVDALRSALAAAASGGALCWRRKRGKGSNGFCLSPGKTLR